MARPSLLTSEMIDVICSRLSEGEPLAQICRDEGMPSYWTVWSWQQDKPDVSQAIARARELGEDVIAYRLRDVARGQAGSSGDVQRDKLIVYTDLQLLSKWNPKKYGDRQAHEISGPNGGPIDNVMEVRFVDAHDGKRKESAQIPPTPKLIPPAS